MKTKILIVSACMFLIPAFLTAAPSENEKNFIKGSISDKIGIIKKLDEKELVPVTLKSFDFIIENAKVLNEDEDFAKLALASVEALPIDEVKLANIKKSDQHLVSEKIMTIFKLLGNKELRSSIFKRLEFYTGEDRALTVSFLNDYLSTAYKINEKAENVLEEAITVTGKIGNEESLSIIYSIWSSKIWKEYQASTDEALVLLSQDSFTDALKIFSASNISDSAHYFNLLHKSSKISQNSLCSIAENALLFAINNAENLKASGKDAKKDFVRFQMETHEVLTEQKWSHAANVINSNILLAKKAWNAGIIGDEDFVKMIKSSANVPSHELAQSLTNMLSECNGKIEASTEDKIEMPAKSVVLALIDVLGELGDRTAFDTLLYVTYLSYPIDVVDEAKKSLALLNW